MDYLKSSNETALEKIRDPTLNVFIPLLEKNRKIIESVRRESMKYGGTERHMFDVYYPSSHEGAKKPPILVYVYGGAFMEGDRVFPPPYDLIYKCAGAFYASRGFLTVIPDYRLLPQAKYPQPMEDVRDALTFVVEHLGDVGDTNKIVMFGHSAGGAIVTSLFLAEPAFVSEDVRKRVRGVMSMGAPHFLAGPAENLREFVVPFYGDEYEKLCTVGLLKNASSETIASLPSLYIVRSEKEPPDLEESHNKFMEVVRQRSVPNVKESIAALHNHITPSMSLSTREEELERFGNDFIAWAKALLEQ